MNELDTNTIGELMEPDPIGFSFAAPGWTMLFVLFLLALAMFALWKLYKYNKNKYRRLALAEISAMDIGQEHCSVIIYNTLSLLKRVAITAYGRDNLASIQGLQFLQFLQAKIENPGFSEESEKIFTKHIYEGNQANVSLEQLELLQIESINWIKMHHV